MKRFYFILLIIASVMLLQSCKKEELLQPDTSSTDNDNNGTEAQIQPYIYNGVNYFYYKDNIALSMNDFIPDTTSSQLLLITGDPGSDSNFINIYINEFTTEELFIEYGRNNQMLIEEILQFENDIHNYIAANNILDYYNTYDTLPDSYYAFENNLYNQYFGSLINSKIIMGTTMHQNYWGGSPSWYTSSAIAYLIFGWNNSISATFPLYLYGFHSLYDKGFYRKRLATIYGFGWSFYRFVGPLSFLNDRTTSIITT